MLVSVRLATLAHLCPRVSPPARPSCVQGELGDCYLLGALSTLGIREERILDVFPDLPQDRTYAMQQLC